MEKDLKDIPDTNFKKYLLEEIPEAFHKDTKGLTLLDINHPSVINHKKLDLRDRQINSLKGVEYFFSLEQIYGDVNNITKTDLRQNLFLKVIHIDR